MNCQIDHCRVPFVDGKWKDAPNCSIAAKLATHLILRYFVISICYTDDGHIASFVNIFTYVLYQLNGDIIFHIDMSLKSYRSTFVSNWSWTIQWVSVISCNGFRNQVSGVAMEHLLSTKQGDLMLKTPQRPCIMCLVTTACNLGSTIYSGISGETM